MSSSPYELLKVEKTATQAEIRKAFLILAKKCHPDKLRAEGKTDDAGEAFRTLRKAYDILSDPNRRERYDRTGVVDDEDSQSFQAAYEFFRGIRVTKEDIERAEAEYRGSADEEADLRAFFESNKGDVSTVLANIIGSTNEDIPRYIAFWEKELEAGRLNKKFKRTFAEVKKNGILTIEQLDDDEEEFDEEDGMDEESGEEEEEEDDEDDQMDDFIASDDDEEEEEESENEPETGALQMPFTPGDLVQARWKQGKKWYDAYILSVNKKQRTYDLDYVKDKVKEYGLPSDCVRAKSEPKKSPNKKVKNQSGEDDLVAQILARREAREAAFEQFAAKYTNPKKKGK